MKGLTMLTVVINALVQQGEKVTVITCLHYVFDLLNSQELECAQLPCNSSINQGPWVRTLIQYNVYKV